jgi:antitoxin (DNA-binding transcriptional repressor) of toxin-antitoxin stability system
MTTRAKPAEVTATDLRVITAKVLRDAEYGTRMFITRDGKPVAELGPITCGHCGEPIRVTVSGTNWVDAGDQDHCPGTDTSHEPAQETA